MDFESDSKIKQFDSFINKTIIGTSKLFFKREMRKLDIEENFIENTFSLNEASLSSCNKDEYDIDTKLLLQKAISQLSDIEQAVIFLLFDRDLPLEASAKELNIYIQSISRIKKRTLEKLRKILEEDDF